MTAWFQLVRSYSRFNDIALIGLAVLIGFVLLLSACKREDRSFHVSTTEATPPSGVRVSTLHPGLESPPPHAVNGFEENALAVSEGKRLFSAFNCVGCHANGGGGMGPPLIDQRWIYGNAPEQIFATITQGRPNGMPAFGDKLTTQQIWQLTAYVRSMSGMISTNVAPGRSDHMKSNPPENSIDPSRPASPQIPKSAEAP